MGLLTLKVRHHHGAYLAAQRIVVIQPKVFSARANTIQERQRRILLTVKECSLTEKNKMHFVTRSHVRNKHVKTKLKPPKHFPGKSEAYVDCNNRVSDQVHVHVVSCLRH